MQRSIQRNINVVVVILVIGVPTNRHAHEVMLVFVSYFDGVGKLPTSSVVGYHDREKTSQRMATILKSLEMFQRIRESSGERCSSQVALPAYVRRRRVCCCHALVGVFCLGNRPKLHLGT